MREFQSKLAVLALGAALICFAIWLSSYVAFAPIILWGDEWAFGPREVAHLFGFVGCVLAVWFCGHSFANTSNMIVTMMIGAVGIGLVVYMCFAPRALKDLISNNAIEAFLYVLYYYLIGCIMGFWLRQQTLWPLQPRRMLIMTSLVLAITSIGWEVYTQPFEHVYQHSPRGYVQYAQVLCDFLGIAIGFWLVNIVIERLETSGGASDCVDLIGFVKELRTLSTVGAKQLKQRFMRSSQTV